MDYHYKDKTVFILKQGPGSSHGTVWSQHHDMKFSVSNHSVHYLMIMVEIPCDFSFSYLTSNKLVQFYVMVPEAIA